MEMKPPGNTWTELTGQRRAAIDARDLSHWSLRQLRAEIGRRESYADRAPVAYWLQRLHAREAELAAEHQLRNLPRHPGLRVVPNRGRSPWTHVITLRETGQVLPGLEYPDSVMARAAADRLVAHCDWTIPAAAHTPEHRAAHAAEQARLEQELGFAVWPELPDTPEGL